MVVEIGCGPGGRRQTDTTAPWIGVDVDLSALQMAKRDPSRRTYLCADALALPIRSSTCDQLIVESVLHHLVPTDDALRELARVLTPAGRLHITDGVALSPDEAATLDAELRAAGHPTEPVYGFDLDELTVMAAGAGLSVVDIQPNGRSTFATPPFVSRTYSTERFTLIAEQTTNS